MSSDVWTGMDRCPKCGGTTQIIVPKITAREKMVYGEDWPHPAEYAEWCDECRGGYIKRIEEIRSRSDIPKRFENTRLRDFDWNAYPDGSGGMVDMTSFQKAANTFLELFGKEECVGLYIHSHERGSGKTFLSCCLGNEIIYRYRASVKFIRESQLLDAVQVTNEWGDTAFSALRECSLLILDDVGTKKTGNNFLDDVLFDLIDARLQANKLMIITSNYERSELRRDSRIVNRLTELAPIPLPEYSVREQRGSNKVRAFYAAAGIA